MSIITKKGASYKDAPGKTCIKNVNKRLNLEELYSALKFVGT